MKLLASLTAVLLTTTLMVSVSFATSPTTPDTQSSATQGNGYEVKMAKGSMHCSGCAEKVSEALKSLPEVDAGSVKVILDSQSAKVQIKPGSQVTAEQIKATIESKTGYKVSSVEELKTKAN